MDSLLIVTPSPRASDAPGRKYECTFPHTKGGK
jgi:hypothetical protein